MLRLVSKQMRVRALKQKIETFRTELAAHRELWSRSLDRTLPDYPVSNGRELEREADSLSRQLGLLRPYIERFVAPDLLPVFSMNLANASRSGMPTISIPGKLSSGPRCG